MSGHGKIKITLELPYGERPIELWRDVSTRMLDECLRRVDLPTDDADSFTRIFICTNPADVERTFKLRQDVAKTIAREIAAGLVEIMERRDTCMGYTKEENREYFGYPKWPAKPVLK